MADGQQGGGPQTNHGIVIGGNARVGDSAMAAGPGAFAQRTGGGEEAALAARAALAAVAALRQRLEEMERASDDALPAERRRAALEETAALEGELASGEADEEQVTGRLRRLHALAAGTTALTGLLTGVQEAVRAVLG
ncbi:hypothetical protein GCM10027168_08270 [Streptomyces capparidis]